jgi:hypothetical protein
MSWTASGLYASALGSVLPQTSAINWNLGSNKFFLTSTSDTPAYASTLTAGVYAVTNECTGTGWAAGGVAVSALAAGPASISPNFTVTTGPPVILNWNATNVSVATTTIATATFGGYFYTLGFGGAKIIGIWFGGSGYTTSAGTFAITWSGGQICTFSLGG